MTYANESLDTMTKHLEDSNTEIWRKAAHKLKGSAANLGAKLLAEYCKTAEMAHDQAIEDRRDLFQKIQNAYDATCTLLSGKLGI
jgi:HPt (histidine-containing phosphotransfer) domain-containing protein